MNKNCLTYLELFTYQDRPVRIMSLEIGNKDGEALCFIRDEQGQDHVVPISQIKDLEPCPKTTPDESQ